MHINDFKVDIRASNVTQKVASASSTVDKVNEFIETMSRIIDMHAPLVTRHIVIRPNTQWFNNDISEGKKTQRAAEKKKQVSRFIDKSSPTRGTTLTNLSIRPNETTLGRRYVKIKTIQRSFFALWMAS